MNGRVDSRWQWLSAVLGVLVVVAVVVVISAQYAGSRRAPVDVELASPPVTVVQQSAPPADPAPTPGYAGLVSHEWADRMSVATGIPTIALIAYAGGSLGANEFFPGCGIGWNTIAAIGLIESDHGRHDGSEVDPTGLVTPPIYGVALDGNGVATIADTDGGVLDGDARHDRAVGPMQFIPQTWRSWAIDGNGDNVPDPQNINDAALASGNYLCHASGGMSTPEGWTSGIAAYNVGDAYLRDVAAAAQRYADSAASVAR